MAMQPVREQLADQPNDQASPGSLALARSEHECFGCGDRNPIGLHLRFTAMEEGVAATFVPLPEHQGFAGVVHGGIISTLLDEAMAWATATAGFWAVTGDLRVRFRHELHVGEPVRIAARLTGSRDKLLTTTAEIVLDEDGEIVATATATFVRVSAEQEAAWRARYLSISP